MLIHIEQCGARRRGADGTTAARGGGTEGNREPPNPWRGAFEISPSKTKTPHYTAHYQRDGQEWTDEGQHIPWVDVLNGPVKWDSTVEIGEKQHRMHAHCVVEIRHYSQIQFNIDMVQTIFRREFNLAMEAAGVPDKRLTGKPYGDVQLLKQNNSKDIVYRYVRKMVGGKSVEINIMPR